MGSIEMSERGSFVTNYFYCDQCFEAASRVLLQDGKGVCSTVIPSGGGQAHPIIAGKIGDSYLGGEINRAEILAEEIRPHICHDMAIAVIPDHGDPEIINIRPGAVRGNYS